ncbi:glycoside hydrolase family 2 protein [Rhizobium sp. RU36D]|uniref:glycosyl hydrolase 2 galactose-binding domain-containing protein n=1 Tax=Rhizobium sp. RU36D TaxID=1907415 RepID=UPI0009D891E4|nr:glycoside hydrolase family 2 protein [Rhizobium sp. RU36D]SMD01902.1 beta-mannosidase [Rhizobium sp. RU36D]
MTTADKVIRYLGADERFLEGGWTMESTTPGLYAAAADIRQRSIRLAAPVPGTAASALAAAGLFDPDNPVPLHDKDFWYFRSLEGEEPGFAVLRFAGLATEAEVYVNGDLRLVSHSMFESHDVPILLTGQDELAICFRALTPLLEKRGPRARWRPQLMDHQGLRLIRTTALGHMPGWCPAIHPVGPYRPINLIRAGSHSLANLAIKADLAADGTGLLTVSFELSGEAKMLTLACAGEETPFVPGPDGLCHAELGIPAIEPWWPHTHGTPKLHDAAILIDGIRHSIGLVGFRRIEIDRGVDGKDFRLLVNGERIFCRGAVWTNADILRLPGAAEDYAPWLASAAEADMNMIRIGGTMTYESADFFRLCDRLGILVWQDLMLANFDYPAGDETFVAHVESEIRQLLAASQGSPSLAVICGGSEIFQQAAMLGLPERIWKSDFFEDALPRLVSSHRPDTAYVANSPSGGPMPFSPGEGVAHYYGVGAYCRPLDDARRANLRFAAESLAFAHIPQQTTLDAQLPVAPVHDPRWKARVPRDRSASWDFEDIRDHYLTELYGLDPARLRRENPERYLQFSRAVTAEVVTETFAEWRRPGSSCNGALVWTLQDLQPGPGWGVIDSTGRPKPVWYGLKRAFRPIQVALTDEGTNGLDVHVINESPRHREVILELTCRREGTQPVVSGRQTLILEPRGQQTLAATSLFGAFFDTTYAFRFGPPSHDVTIARLSDATTGDILAEAFHFPLGRSQALHAADLKVEVVESGRGWMIEIASDTLAQSVHVAADGYRASDDWFHLAPGAPKRVKLIPEGSATPTGKPSGTVTHLGSSKRFSF